MRIRNHLLVLLAFSGLSIILTWPLVLHFNTHLPGPVEDNLQSLWNFWWVRRAVWGQHTHPYYTTYLFYPTGTSLALHTLSLFNTLNGIILQFLFSPIASYNIMIMLGFILSGWTAYMLVYHLTRNHGAAWIGGVIFAFSPYHLAHALHHINLASIQFIPLYALGLLKIVAAEPAPVGVNGGFSLRPNCNSVSIGVPAQAEASGYTHYKWALAAGISLLLAALCCWYYLTYLAIFTLFFLVWLGLARPRIFTGEIRRSLAILVGVSAVLILPFIFPMLKEMYYNMPYMTKNVQLDFSADLLAFFIPPASQPLWGKLGVIQGAYRNFTGLEWEATVYLGFTALALAGVGMINCKGYFGLSPDRNSQMNHYPQGFRSGDRPKYHAFWLFSGIGFAVLALGPRLHIWGKIWLPWLPLPYSLLHRIPLIGMSSVPSRFVVMVTLSLSVLAGYGMARILKSLRRPVQGIVLVGLTGLILLEYANVPMLLSNPEAAAHMHLFSGIIRDNEDYAILELPITGYTANEIFMYRQTKHHKRLLFGSVSRLSLTAIKPLLDSPLFKLYGTPLSTAYFQEIKPLLLQNKIRYIVMNRCIYDWETNVSRADEINLLLKKTFPLEARCGNDVFIYRVNQ